MAMSALVALLGHSHRAMAAAGDPAFFPTATGLIELGAADSTWYAAKLSLDDGETRHDPAAGAAGFVIVTDGPLRIADDRTGQITLLQAGAAAFIPADETAEFAAMDDGASVWRIAVAASDADAPLARGDGVGRPVVARDSGDSKADDKAVRAVELRLGVLPGGSELSVGNESEQVPLVYVIEGELFFDDGSSAADGHMVAMPPADNDGEVPLSTDDGVVVVYLAVGPALDPSDLKAASSSKRGGGSSSGSSNSGGSSSNSGNSGGNGNSNNTNNGNTGNGGNSGNNGNSGNSGGSGTDPADLDSDNDDLSDAAEAEHGTDPNNPDTDGDGVTDRMEIFDLNTNPTDPDTDLDGLGDGEEVNNPDVITNPNLFDGDNDGLSDGDEVKNFRTNPNNPDTDGDGLSDGQEASLRTDPLDPNGDADFDGLSDAQEVLQVGSRPDRSDSDQDGLDDPEELNAGTDPLNTDTDADGWNDDGEILNGSNPLVADGDGDGLGDGAELNAGTDRDNPDTDGDGWSDGAEVAAGTSPTFNGSHP
jgi:hypothetical protein